MGHSCWHRCRCRVCRRILENQIPRRDVDGAAVWLAGLKVGLEDRQTGHLLRVITITLLLPLLPLLGLTQPLTQPQKVAC